MKKIIQILIISLLVSNVCWGQLWYFGNKAAINFNNGGTVTSSTGNELYSLEGTAITNDQNGNLLFYTNGNYIIDKDGNEMLFNGVSAELNGDQGSTQSAVILPVPSLISNCGKKYYIFTVGEATSTLKNGLYYSIVEIDALHPNGYVSTLNTQLIADTITEKITAFNDGAGGYWFIAHGFDLNFDSHNIPLNYSGDGVTFHKFHITPSNPIPSTANPLVYSTQEIGNVHCLSAWLPFGKEMDAAGQMKFSLTGRRLAVALYSKDSIDLFDFNRSTGMMTNFRTISDVTSADNDKDALIYGLEFSPDEDILYASSINGKYTGIYQFNLLSATFTRNVLISGGSGWNFGLLQIGPDRRIYCANQESNSNTFLSVINFPDRFNIGNTNNCGFVAQGVLLTTGNSTMGLPTVIQNEFNCGEVVINDECTQCHNINFYYNGNIKLSKDSTIKIGCNKRNFDFFINSGCNAPNIIPVLGCRVTDINGTAQSWANTFTSNKGNGSLTIPSTNPNAVYFLDYYFGTTLSNGSKDTCGRIRLKIIDTCFDPPCICPPKPTITLTQIGRQGLVKQLNCGATAEIECNKLYTLNVDPACQPAGCSDKRYEISVRANGGLTQTFINQAVNIQPLATDKEFTITIKTYCGGKLCTTCTITLTVKCKCPPPPCCKTLVGTEFNATVSTVREVSGTSFANLSFALNGNGKQYTQVRASVISFGIKADDKKCLDCYNNSRQWASIAGGNLTGVQGFSRVISGENNGNNTNSREVMYTSTVPQIINTAQLTLNLMLPPMQTLSCCNVYATVYIKFTYRDNQCNECEKIIGIKIPLNGQLGKQPELITTAANIRAASPAK